ncbi:hypothetical protein Y032_0333g2821 [Ancylostoma ceylanicum]|uniref:Uncharacterized protein n=1 Tax=Ancylostoma ceylanicum TaxID=53326 RepID=A0A016RZ20_9BILA|nr:hypothetical protein Y032_0333g2821 [Ancylostoma ceylanicum]
MANISVVDVALFQSYLILKQKLPIGTELMNQPNINTILDNAFEKKRFALIFGVSLVHFPCEYSKGGSDWSW